MTSRILVSFSCGAASAAAAKLAVEEFDNVEVIYCDTFAYEHPKAGRYSKEPDLSCGVWCGQQ